MKNHRLHLFLRFVLLLEASLFSFACSSKIIPSIKPDRGLANTPPMGWNSWNKFQCDIREDIVREVADAMVTNGMRDAGYQFICLDDCWMQNDRVDGHLKADSKTFPNGIKALADYVHSKGLKLGIYSDRGRKTCQGRDSSFGYETTDARDFADWGVDYLKYDDCNLPSNVSDRDGYRKMRDALLATGHPIVFSICAWGFQDWMPEIGNLWRTTGDIHDQWDDVVNHVNENEQYSSRSHVGAWNDPDMLEVGNDGMTTEEYKSHFSLWAVMTAPLIAGNDVRNMSKETREILTNTEVIAVDQDPWGLQGVKVWEGGDGLAVYSKVLAGANKRAVVLFNRSAFPAKVTARWSDLGLPPGPASVRDLWAHKDLGNFQEAFQSDVPPHGVVMLKVVSQEP